MPEIVLREESQHLPAIRARRGEDFSLRLRNEMSTPIALHWRGVRLRNDMDGSAPLTGPWLAPGTSTEIHFTAPDAGTFLAHAGLREQAIGQIATGVIFPFIVTSESDPACDDDFVFLLQDQVTSEPTSPRILINGQDMAAAYDLRPGARLRLRIASASTQRMMSIGLDGGTCLVAAIDGQPCGLFEPDRQTFPLAPGQRYDLFIDLPRVAEQEVSLQLRSLGGLGSDGHAETRLAIFRTLGHPLPERGTFAGLPPNPLLPERIALEKATRRDLLLERTKDGSWQIDGQPAQPYPSRPLFIVKRGTPVTLGFINKTGRPQLMHVHGHVMRHIHLFDDGWDPYWRDTIIVPDGRTMRVAFVADNPGRWPIVGGFGQADGPAGWFQVD